MIAISITPVKKLLIIAVFISLVCSFIILLEKLLTINSSNFGSTSPPEKNKIYINTWEFPMLLAIFFDTIYNM